MRHILAEIRSYFACRGLLAVGGAVFMFRLFIDLRFPDTPDGVEPSVSLLFFRGFSQRVHTLALSLALHPTEHSDSVAEPVGERNHSDWLFG